MGRARAAALSRRAARKSALSFDVQPPLAAALGFKDDNPRRAVEAFMKAYFLVAKDVGDLTRIFCAALEEQNRKQKPALSRLLPGFLKPRTGDDDFFVENGRLNAPANAFSRDPVNLIRIFHIADEKNVDVHPDALRTITRSLDLITDDFAHDPEANRLFLAILSSRRDPERALRRMNEAGVFGRFVPEFGRVVGLMQFNMYHHYTVDEHLIRAVGNVAAIERGAFKGEHPLSSDIIKRIKSREALYCAMLLHDIAKGLPGDHSDVGAAIAESLCPRWGLSPRRHPAPLSWLVKQPSGDERHRAEARHLRSQDGARFRRRRADAGDAAPAAGAHGRRHPRGRARRVERLEGPAAARALLRSRSADDRRRCGARPAPRGSSRRRPASAHASRILPDRARERALSRHYDSYWLAFDDAAHERHARLMAAADANGDLIALAAESNDFRAVTEIVIYTPDHPGLFSQLAGAISVSGGSIVDAKVFTTTDGFALDVFSVQDAEGGPFGDVARVERLRQAIEKTLAGEIAPARRLRQAPPKKRTSAFRVRPRVHFDNEASTTATVVEVEGLDRPGLLYEVTRALFESGLSISSAIVSTYGERAMDVFYVRDGFGHKVPHPARLKAVEERLLKALEGRAP